jgi:hypothetical protein
LQRGRFHELIIAGIARFVNYIITHRSDWRPVRFPHQEHQLGNAAAEVRGGPAEALKRLVGINPPLVEAQVLRLPDQFSLGLSM